MESHRSVDEGTVGCNGQIQEHRHKYCPVAVPQIQVEKVDGGILLQGVQIASSCQVALHISGCLFLIIGTIITVMAYQGQTPEEDSETYNQRVSSSTNSRVLGPVCLAIGLIMLLAGLLICSLTKYAQTKDQRVCFHCPIHGDFFPTTPVPVSAVQGRKSSIFFSVSHPVPLRNPPMCPYSHLLSARNSIISNCLCPSPKPFVIDNSLRCIEYFWPLAVTHDIACFPTSRTPSPVPVEQLADVESGAGPVMHSTLPEVKLVAPATNRDEVNTKNSCLQIPN